MTTVLQLTKDLIRFKSVTGNKQELDKCITYILDYFKDTKIFTKKYETPDTPTVLFLSNCDEQEKQYDVLMLGHIDVVPADDIMFNPTEKDSKLYGRGSLDMKSWVAVAMNSLKHVINNNIDIKFALAITTDEEKGGKGAEYFVEQAGIKSTVVLDNDVGGDIKEIILKCKNPNIIKITATGKEAHGSMPWDGDDAIEKLMLTIANIRKLYPYHSIHTGEPKDTWIDTMHTGIINAGTAPNCIPDIAEATLDIRLTDTSSVEDLKKKLDSCMLDGVSYEIASTSIPVLMEEDNKHIKAYKNFAEKALGFDLEFVTMGGATDSRLFATLGSTIIMHSGTGAGMHSKIEYVEIDSLNKISQIQIAFLEKFKELI